jgi:hypothetical protein
MDIKNVSEFCDSVSEWKLNDFGMLSGVLGESIELIIPKL